MENSQLWRRNPAVTAGKVLETNSQLNYGGPLTAMACVELLDRADELVG